MASHPTTPGARSSQSELRDIAPYNPGNSVGRDVYIAPLGLKYALDKCQVKRYYYKSLNTEAGDAADQSLRKGTNVIMSQDAGGDAAALPVIKTSPPKKKRGFLFELKKNKILFIMLIPAFLYFLIFRYAPMAGVYLAFNKYNYIDGIFKSPFVGMDNFRFLYISGALFNITKNTVLYNIAFLITGNICQIAVAIFISEIPGRYFKKTSQSLMFLPYFVSYVLVGLVVYNILNYETGLLNSILVSLGFDRVDMYANVGAWKYILVMFNIWKGIGYGSVIYLAAIMGIDREMYEAAKIDSANIFQQTRYITLPMIKPTFIILVLLQLGNILRGQFELFYQIIGSNGTLYRATDIIDTYVFRALINAFDIGMGTAVGLYQSFFGFLLIMTVNTIVKKVSPEYALF